MSISPSLSEAIENLSKKKHVINEDAIKAGQERQLLDSAPQIKKKLSVVEEFSHSVHLLTRIFKESSFDDLVMFVAHPARVLIINFFIGIVRGLGFIIGIAIAFGAIAYVFPNHSPIQTLIGLIHT